MEFNHGEKRGLTLIVPSGCSSLIKYSGVSSLKPELDIRFSISIDFDIIYIIYTYFYIIYSIFLIQI